jgi:hypothetical protein
MTRNLQTSEKWELARGRRCPLCNSVVGILIYWCCWDADTMEMLEEFYLCQRCHQAKYVLA